MTEEEKTDSEFGKGLTYCLGLFLAHAEREMYEIGGKKNFQFWFNTSSDHAYEVDTSRITDESLKERIENWREKVLHWGHGFPGPDVTEADMDWAIEEAKQLLLLIDQLLLQIPAIEANYS